MATLSAENVGLDLGEGDTQPVSDVLVGHLLVVVEHEGNALMIGQTLERPLHPRPPLIRLQLRQHGVENAGGGIELLLAAYRRRTLPRRGASAYGAG